VTEKEARDGSVPPGDDHGRGRGDQPATARTESVRLVERATIIEQARQGQQVPAIAKDLRLGEDTVRLWLKRFKAKGMKGLADEARGVRPVTYSPE